MIYSDTNSIIMEKLQNRTDKEAKKIQRLLRMPDLTRKKQSPVRLITEAIASVKEFNDFDLVEVPDIVPTELNFDLLNTPLHHETRDPKNIYYLDDAHVLRTHMTVMWAYFLSDPKIVHQLDTEGSVKALSYGKVYRKDEIDQCHFPVFHQIDGLYVCDRAFNEFNLKDVVDILIDIAQAVYGKGIQWRIEEAIFPFSEPNIEFQIFWKNEWIEVLGAGLVHSKVLSLLGLDPIQYNGWAIGFGLDRLAMIKMDIPDIRILWTEDKKICNQFVDCNSVFKGATEFTRDERDITFSIDRHIGVNEVYELIRDSDENINEDDTIIEKVTLLNSIEVESGSEYIRHIRYTLRVHYHSPFKDVQKERINTTHASICTNLVNEMKAVFNN